MFYHTNVFQREHNMKAQHCFTIKLRVTVSQTNYRQERVNSLGYW